ncbi:MAG: hypothetical protein AAFV53_32290 [Myxococcota bacterium]
MVDAAWLVLLAPLGAAIALGVSPRAAVARAGWLAAAIGAALIVLFPPPPATAIAVSWLPQNQRALLSLGLQVDGFSGMALLSLLVSVAALRWRETPRPEAQVLISASAALLFSPGIAQASAAVAIIGFLGWRMAGDGPDSVRRFTSQRLADGLALLAIAALYHHAAGLSWDASIVGDSPPALLIAALLAAAAAGAAGLLPWPRLKDLDPMALLAAGLAGGVLLMREIEILQSSEAVCVAVSGLGALTAAAAGLDGARRGHPQPTLAVWPALIALLASIGEEGWAAVAVVLWPPLVLLAHTTAGALLTLALIALPGAILWGVTLDGLVADQRWAPLTLSVVSIVLMGMSTPKPRAPQGRTWILAVGMLLLLSSASIALINIWGMRLAAPAVWSIGAALALGAAGAVVGAREGLPVIDVSVVWDQGWRGVHRGLRRMPRWKAPDLPEWPAMGSASWGWSGGAALAVGGALAFIIYALAVGGLG